jgi:predicted N-acetyltransferase YhbS
LITPESITALHRVDGFDCGEASLNTWLVSRAIRNHIEGYTHVRVIADVGSVVGYYGLATASIIASALPRSVRGGQPPDPVPALLLGRFAVDVGHQGKGFGLALFADAMRRSVAVADLVGARAVVIHAVDVKACAFYQKHGFISTIAEPLTLYQSIQRIRAAL